MSENIKAVVCGAAGRMGSQIVKAINNADGIELVGAIETKKDLANVFVPDTKVLYTLSGYGGSESLFQRQMSLLTSVILKSQ